jgi:hypothetical protein
MELEPLKEINLDDGDEEEEDSFKEGTKHTCNDEINYLSNLLFATL